MLLLLLLLWWWWWYSSSSSLCLVPHVQSLPVTLHQHGSVISQVHLEGGADDQRQPAACTTSSASSKRFNKDLQPPLLSSCLQGWVCQRRGQDEPQPNTLLVVLHCGGTTAPHALWLALAVCTYTCCCRRRVQQHRCPPVREEVHCGVEARLPRLVLDGGLRAAVVKHSARRLWARGPRWTVQLPL